MRHNGRQADCGLGDTPCCYVAILGSMLDVLNFHKFQCFITNEEFLLSKASLLEFLESLRKMHFSVDLRRTS